MADGDVSGPEGRSGGVEQGIVALGGKGLDFSHFSGLKPLGDPKPGDWLWHCEEPGETVEEYMEGVEEGAMRDRKLYIRAVGEDRLEVKGFAEYLESFLCVSVEVMDAVEVRPLRPEELLACGAVGDDPDTIFAPAWLGESSISARYHMKDAAGCAACGEAGKVGEMQLHVGEVVLELAKDVPADALSVIGVCTYDLYDEEDDLMQMGLGDKDVKAGVVSISRYHPRAKGTTGPRWHSLRCPKTTKPRDLATWRRRVLATLSHEALHTLHLEHCIWWRCLMNGSGNLKEDTTAPLHLCPVCLAKLTHATATRRKVRQRAQNLINCAKALKFTPSSVWTELSARDGEKEDGGGGKRRKKG